MFKIEKCSVVRQNREILSSVSVAFKPGSITALIGPNGAGKSTLLRLLSGDIEPDTGSVWLNDKQLGEWPIEQLSRFRAVLPQESALSFPFTVEEVVALGRIPHRAALPHEADAQIIFRCLEQVDMADKAAQLYPTLSGGEKQRVQFARLLAQLATLPHNTAPVILLDEPVAALDPAHRFATLELAEEQANAGATVVIVLHDVNLVSAFAHELIALKNGRLISSGSVADTLTPDLIKTLFEVEAQSVSLPGMSRPNIVLIPNARK